MLLAPVSAPAAVLPLLPGVYIFPFTVPRAGDVAGISTKAKAWVPWWALVVGSLIDGGSVRGVVGAGNESANDQGRGTQWSVGPGGGLVREGWRALAGPRTGDLRLLAAAKDRQRKGLADGLRGLDRDGP